MGAADPCALIGRASQGLHGSVHFAAQGSAATRKIFVLIAECVQMGHLH